MDKLTRKNMAEEARKQTEALRTIGMWRTGALALSAAGVAAAYAGLGGAVKSLPLGSFGLLMAVVGFGAALVLNLGIRNGKRNVKKILKLLQTKQEEAI